MRGSLLLVAAVALVVAAAPATAARPCTGQFEGFVLHGPDAGLTLTGTIAIAVDEAGAITGTLKTRGATIPVSGAVHGQSLHLVFTLEDGSTISGVGPINKNDLASCAGVTEGTLAGPAAGDTGNWGIVWGS